MGPSSVRRDILNKYHQEKRQLGITSRGRRGRRSRRTADDTAAHDSGINTTDISAVPPTHAGGSGRAPNSFSDKENESPAPSEDHEIEDDEEFFDAEDASRAGPRATEDEELDYNEIE